MFFHSRFLQYLIYTGIHICALFKSLLNLKYKMPMLQILSFIIRLPTFKWPLADDSTTANVTRGVDICLHYPDRFRPSWLHTPMREGGIPTFLMPKEVIERREGINLCFGVQRKSKASSCITENVGLKLWYRRGYLDGRRSMRRASGNKSIITNQQRRAKSIR